MARRRQPPERENLASFRQYLVLHGCLVWRRNVAQVPMEYRGKQRVIRCGEKGQSDLWGFLPNGDASHFECEVKRPGGVPTADQIAWLRLINTRTRGYAFWADSLPMLDRVYRKIMQGWRVIVEKDGSQYLDDGK